MDLLPAYAHINVRGPQPMQTRRRATGGNTREVRVGQGSTNFPLRPRMAAGPGSLSAGPGSLVTAAAGWTQLQPLVAPQPSQT